MGFPFTRMTSGLLGSILAIALFMALVSINSVPSARSADSIPSVSAVDDSPALSNPCDAAVTPQVGDASFDLAAPNEQDENRSDSTCRPTNFTHHEAPEDSLANAFGQLRLLTIPVPILVGRLKKGRLLEHPSRQRIVDAVHANPGTHHRELQRNLQVSNGTLAYHIHRLERAGLLRSFEASGRKCHYIPGDVADQKRPHVTVCERVLLAALSELHSAGIHELGQVVGLKAASVAYHIGKLRSQGVVEARRHGHIIMLSPSVDGLTSKIRTTNHRPV